MTSATEDSDEGGRGPQRILIIEDNRDAADTLGEILKLFGYDVRIAYSGPAGIEAATQWGPSVVLSDIGLPEMDGFEVARALRGRTKTAGTRLIALTAYGTEEDRRLAQQAGFDNYITKPADLGALREMLATPDRRNFERPLPRSPQKKRLTPTEFRNEN